MESSIPDRISTTLDAVVTRFATMVRSVGVRHRLDESDLDEVLQEVRIRIWRADPSGEQIERLGASYVYRTATSAALDLLRRRRARAADRTESVEERSHTLPHADPTPIELLERGELTDRILAAVDTIAMPRRVAVRMYLTGYEREEIADLMGWSEAKTRNLVYRGLADLRERLTEHGITLERAE